MGKRVGRGCGFIVGFEKRVKMIPDSALKVFKALYAEFYDNLPENYVQKIFPFFMQIGKDYNISQPRCLFVGKATNGWVTESRDIDELFFHEYPTKRIVNRGDDIEWVEWCAQKNNVYNSNRSAFWRVIKATTKTIFPKGYWYTHIAWSNVYKFAPERGNPDYAFQKMQRDVCIKILNKEIEFLHPDFVVFLTSNWEWFFINHIGMNTKDAKCHVWGKYRTYYQNKDGVTYIQSQHPQGKLCSMHADILTKIIKEDMSLDLMERKMD